MPNVKTASNSKSDSDNGINIILIEFMGLTARKETMSDVSFGCLLEYSQRSVEYLA